MAALVVDLELHSARAVVSEGADGSLVPGEEVVAQKEQVASVHH
jgi:hypothetical protein